MPIAGLQKTLNSPFGANCPLERKKLKVINNNEACNRKKLQAFVLAQKFVQLNIFDNAPQGFGHPFIFMVDELLPDINLHIANVKVAKRSRFDGFAGYKIGQKGYHIAF